MDTFDGCSSKWISRSKFFIQMKWKMVDFLLSHGAETEKKDSTGRTAQDIAKLLKNDIKWK
jgi:ankyrin repeat protein